MRSSIVYSFALLSSGLVEAAHAPQVTAAPIKREDDNPYATYPSVARTASINGFADLIYDQMPTCAQPCMFANYGATPCPYWDTGCLCIMPTFAGEIAQCIAENCRGQDVLDARSLATSQCSAAGVWDPYWMVNAADDLLLQSAATASPITTSVSETAAPSSQEPSITETEASSQPNVTSAPTSSSTSTGTPIVRTATINGFADRIYDELPECARSCMNADTGMTPCPYWDTGCLCVMPNFAGTIGSCIADQCQGEDVVSATELGQSACSVAGVTNDGYWLYPASVAAELAYAATAVPTSSDVSSVTSAPTSSSTSTGTPIVRTATINGFADRIYDELPECARSCMNADTGMTPCPYWDTGCLCVMPNFAGTIGSCIADQCQGEDVVSATELGQSACSVAGVTNDGYWLYPASVAAELAYAATAVPTSSDVSSFTSAPSSSQSEVASSSPFPSESSSAIPSASSVSPSQSSAAAGESSAEAQSSEVINSNSSFSSEYLNESVTVVNTAIITETVCTLCTHQSSINNEQESANSVQASAISEANKVITTIVSCESAINSIETILKTATETVVINSCESAISSFKSAESQAYASLSSLQSVEGSAVSVQTECASEQLSIASDLASTDNESIAQSVQQQASVAQNNAYAAHSSGQKLQESIAALTQISQVEETGQAQASQIVELANNGGKNIVTMSLVLLGTFFGMLI